MNNFYFTLPLAFDDMQKRQTSDSKNTAWLYGAPAVRAYWKIIGIKIDIFAQIAFSSANLGLDKDIYERFSCSKITSDCLCAQPMQERALRNGRTFLEADCDFASLCLDGPYFKSDEEKALPFPEREVGFCIDFSFDWNGIHATTEDLQKDPYLFFVGEAGMGESSTVPIYCIDTTASVHEIRHIDINIDYIYDKE